MIRIANKLLKSTAALIYTEVNRKYLTGFQSSLGYLLISKNDAVLFVDGRYILAAKQSVKNCRVELCTKPQDNITEFIVKNNITSVLCEDTLTVAQFNMFKEMLSDVNVTTNSVLRQSIDNLRQIKFPYEIECIINAQRIAEKAYNEVLNFIEVGVSEIEIAAELEYRMKKYGSEIPSFDTIAVSGKKTAMPHGVPDGTVVKAGDFVTMDFGAVVNGYHSDMTRTVAVGYATDKMISVYETVLKAQDQAEKTVKPRVKCSTVDKAARGVIAKAGYGRYFTHSTGHSVGLEIHELPSLSQNSTQMLKKGQIITNEPGIYIDGEYGVRIEDMLLVTDSGCENLTNCEKSLIIL